MSDYYFRSLKNQALLVFIGNKENFEILKENFLDLRVGDKITQIGDSTKGGMAVLNREAKFRPFIYYAGIRYEKIHLNSNKKEKLLMFRVRDEDKPEGILESDDFYCAFIILKDKLKGSFELKVPDIENNAINIFQPIFFKK